MTMSQSKSPMERRAMKAHMRLGLLRRDKLPGLRRLMLNNKR